MPDNESMIIFDADGVFMNEMPYWQTALAAALVRHGLGPQSSGQWDALGRACLVERRLQRITKGRGCNSNWDLTAVMMRALADDAVCAQVGSAIGAEDYAGAAAALGDGMEALWSGLPAEGHRLAGFGIDRDGDVFSEAVAEFQVIFTNPGAVAWAYPRQDLAQSVEVTQGVFDRLREHGVGLGVCTSRHRDETIDPMRSFEILGYFNPTRIITQSIIEDAQQATGVRPLGKPHWFPVACAALGTDAARRMLAGDAAAPKNGAMSVYVGDAPADYDAVFAARDRGVRIEYVHIDTDLTDAETTARIREGDATRAVVPDLPAAADVVERLLA